jgi:hypothetical protein
VTADFVLSDDGLSRLSRTFDLVHSVIVLQHISPARGERIFARLLDLVSPGGIAAIHVTYFTPSRRPKRLLHWARARVPGLAALANVMLGQPIGTPHIPMSEYDLRRIFRAASEMSADTHVLHTDHAGNLGVFIFCRRSGAPR